MAEAAVTHSRGGMKPSDYRRPACILDFFAARDGNVAERTALRAEDLSSPLHYLQLMEFVVHEAVRRGVDRVCSALDLPRSTTSEQVRAAPVVGA